MRWTGHDYIKQYEMGRSRGTHVTVKECVQGYRGTLKKKRKSEIPKPRREGNIKVDIQEIGRKNLEWI